MNERPHLRLIQGYAPHPLWERLKPLGGSESDTYAEVLTSYEWNDVQQGDYALVQSDPSDNGEFVWLKSKVGVCGNLFDPDLNEYKIVWKDGKPV